MGQEDNSEAVIEFLYRSESETDLTEFKNILDEESGFEKNETFSQPVYDLNGSRVFIYPQSGYVRLMQKMEEPDNPDHDYNIEDNFSLENTALRRIGDAAELEEL